MLFFISAGVYITKIVNFIIQTFSQLILLLPVNFPLEPAKFTTSVHLMHIIFITTIISIISMTIVDILLILLVLITISIIIFVIVVIVIII